MKSIFAMLIGMIWVAGFIFIHQYWHWDGVGCLIGSLPGLFVFIAHAGNIVGRTR